MARSIDVKVFDVPPDWKSSSYDPYVLSSQNVHDNFQHFLTKLGYWGSREKYAYLVSSLEPDEDARFSDLEGLLNKKETVLAYKPLDGENRDGYCNKLFLSGNAGVAIYKKDRLQLSEGRLFEYSVVGTPVEAVAAVVLPSTAGLNV